MALEPLGRGFLADHHADVHDGSHDLVAAALRVGLLARALDDIERLCTTRVIDFCLCVLFWLHFCFVEFRSEEVQSKEIGPAITHTRGCRSQNGMVFECGPFSRRIAD